jgi:hypothetical protein
MTSLRIEVGVDNVRTSLMGDPSSPGSTPSDSGDLLRSGNWHTGPGSVTAEHVKGLGCTLDFPPTAFSMPGKCFPSHRTRYRRAIGSVESCVARPFSITSAPEFMTSAWCSQHRAPLPVTTSPAQVIL